MTSVNPIIEQKREQLRQQRRLQTAIHEAGHVLGARLHGSKVKSATIVATKDYQGIVYSTTIKWEENVIEYLLGYAAEIQFGYVERRRWFQGHGEDYARAEKAIKEHLRYKKSEAWSEQTGIKGWRGTVPCHRHDFQLGVHYKMWRKAVRIAKGEWTPIFNRLRRKARRLAEKHAVYIKKVADLLTEKDTLTDEEIPHL